MPNKNNKYLGIILLVLLTLSLPIVIWLIRGGRFDIRPRALNGNADLLLYSSGTSYNIGDEFNVLVSLRLNHSTLRVSGVDFVLLYDREKLDVVNVRPQVPSTETGAAFTDAPIVSHSGHFDSVYDFLRVAEVARRPDNQLSGGTVNLAWVTFRAKANGQAGIKFPGNEYLEIVGKNIQ